MTRSQFRSALAASLLLAAPLPAFAHAHLQSATPAVGSTVKAAPAELSITFSESVEPKFSTIVVRDASGTEVDRGKLHLAGAGNRLAIGLKPLAPGQYTVTWHATSTDTHKTQGRFFFTVQP